MKKTTVEINDLVMLRAKRLADRTGRPLRALVEEGLQRVLEESERRVRFQLPDCAVGEPGAPDPLEGLSWQDLREQIYGAAGHERG